MSEFFKMTFASIYPHYVTKAEKKGHTKEDVDTIICWLTGYDNKSLKKTIKDEITFERIY